MIDLRSDTVTTPSRRMREAVLDAPVGDDKRDGDPTVGDLESAVADRLGTADALFCPSGSMANQVAVAVHTDPRQEVIHDRWTHVYTSEYATMAAVSGLQSRFVDADPRGCPTPDEIHAAHGEQSQWPGIGLLSLENTHNKRGGTAIAPESIEAAAEAARDHGIGVHLDGARLANAAVALDREMADFTAGVDSTMLDLSKGLGAPMGSVLAGAESFIAEARHYRNAFGGGLRQAGIVAAPALVALENVDRLETDHANAAVLATRLADETPLDVVEPDTNIVVADVRPTGLDAAGVLDRCAGGDVLGSAIGDSRVRFCTHLDVDREEVETAADRVGAAL
jgi:threonine aldolase